jgi:hypothetical protein
MAIADRRLQNKLCHRRLVTRNNYDLADAKIKISLALIDARAKCATLLLTQCTVSRFSEQPRRMITSELIDRKNK